MKVILSCLIVGMFVLSGLGAVANTSVQPFKMITDSVTFSTPIINEEKQYTTITLPEATSSTTEAGKPTLPVVTQVYTFPFGTQIQDVKVTFSEPNTRVLTQPVKLASTPKVLSLDAAVEQLTTTTESSNTAMYPETTWRYRVGAGLDGITHVIYLSVHYCPVTYMAATQTLFIRNHASIQISYTLPDSPKTFADTYQLLIIAPAQFSDALQPFVNFKNSNGVPTKLVTLEEIPSVGYDKQEDIKYYIKDAIETWGITYVLIVGAGVNGSEIFPVRYAWVPSEGYENCFPSDLYYADIYNSIGLFSSWDFNGNHKYAEYPIDMLAVDLYPDVYLARWPCNDVTEVKTIVRKTMNFIQHNKQKGTILQMGGDSFVQGDYENINEGEYANTKVMEKLPGYQTTQLWASNGQLTKSNIILGFYKGVDFADFNGHGNPIVWATHPTGNENVWIPTGTKWSGFTYVEVYFLFNFYKLPIIFINACSTNKFSDSDTCLGWSFMKKQIGGGIAAFGASGIGYGIPGSGEVDELFGWMEVHTFDNLYTTKIVGNAWGTSVAGYVNEFGWSMFDADYKTVMELSIFSDPSLPVFPQ